MPLPKERLSISSAQSNVIVPGLEIIVIGIANARLGCYPHARPDFLIHSQRKSIYKNQAFDEEFAAQILWLRNQLKGLSGTRKLRLDVFDLATVQFALRVTSKLTNVSSNARQQAELKERLNAKLEKYRKRARGRRRSKSEPPVIASKSNGGMDSSVGSDTTCCVSGCRDGIMRFSAWSGSNKLRT